MIHLLIPLLLFSQMLLRWYLFWSFIMNHTHWSCGRKLRSHINSARSGIHKVCTRILKLLLLLFFPIYSPLRCLLLIWKVDLLSIWHATLNVSIQSLFLRTVTVNSCRSCIIWEISCIQLSLIIKLDLIVLNSGIISVNWGLLLARISVWRILVLLS